MSEIPQATQEQLSPSRLAGFREIITGWLRRHPGGTFVKPTSGEKPLPPTVFDREGNVLAGPAPVELHVADDGRPVSRRGLQAAAKTAEGELLRRDEAADQKRGEIITHVPDVTAHEKDLEATQPRQIPSDLDNAPLAPPAERGDGKFGFGTVQVGKVGPQGIRQASVANPGAVENLGGGYYQTK